jgi:DegV family protein with EDD domain
LQFGDETVLDKVDITHDEFMHRLTSSTVFPRTSQPSVGAFEETFRRLAADDLPIVSIHVSSHLSGTYQSAVLAASSVAAEGATIRVLDSLTASLALGVMVIAAARLARDDADLDAIVAQVEHMIPRTHLYFTVDTLEYLQRGGRIGRAQAMLGALLNIKPILRVENGQVAPVRRERTRARAVEALVAIASDLRQVELLGVIHSEAAAEAQTLASRLAAAVAPARSPSDVLITQFGPVVGAHIGPGGMGFVAYDRSATLA